MIYKGKLPRAAVGEIQHEINTPLGIIFMSSAENYRVNNAAVRIRDYIKKLGEKSHFDSDPFNEEKTIESHLPDDYAFQLIIALVTGFIAGGFSVLLAVVTI